MNDVAKENEHQRYSVECFNTAWELIEKTGRSAQEDATMLEAAFASIWHWKNRKDCADRNLAIGYWQVSRVFALLDEPRNARKFGGMSLAHSPADDPYLVAYAHESIARAEMIAQNPDSARKHLRQAWQLAEQIRSAEDKAYLTADLRQLE